MTISVSDASTSAAEWRRLVTRPAFGDVTPLSTMRFAGGGNAFTVAGTPIARDAALIEAGLDLGLSPDATFGLSYAGQIASGAQDHGFKVNLNVRF